MSKYYGIFKVGDNTAAACVAYHYTSREKAEESAANSSKYGPDTYEVRPLTAKGVKAIEKEQAREFLLKHLTKGARVYFLKTYHDTHHNSGGLRHYRVFIPAVENDGTAAIWEITGQAAAATERQTARNGDILIYGCGFDGADEIGGDLCRALWPDETTAYYKNTAAPDSENPERYLKTEELTAV